ncbi:MAG: DNA strand exchange inhibitor protein [Paludisphaera borealis]|uniref:endonuclease MutS2 n=1 Tax=Paludisphaera borealis TaxID=1387353 RepID=UPI00284B1B36|nr:DNA strand exchange inhibitor protein [Paludisphaera borealis]MDR3618538.1 DNA strand exchange inhibitor protein [Paludisphaera borealis]
MSQPRGDMDSHTLDLLGLDKIRALVAARAACSLGKDAARGLEPLQDPGEIHAKQALTTEMAEAIISGLQPPLGGLHDIRPLVRRAQVGAMLEAEELAEVAETLRSMGNLDAWLVRIGDRFPRLGGLRQEVGEFSGVSTAIEGCLDSRAKMLDSASRRLAALRREISQVEERIQETLRSMLRSPEIRRALRYPNFTMVGHHYVIPVAKEHRGEISGSVQRTSASSETVYIEPTAIAEKSAQLSYIRAREAKEIRRILRWLSAQVGQVGDALLRTLVVMAEIDLIFAKARYSLDYRMTAVDISNDGKLVLRKARHPLLEAILRRDPALGLEPLPAPQAQEARGAATEADPVSGEAASSEAVSVASASPAPRPREVVPIDVHLGLRFRMLVITGPNTGGKTVALKTVGLLSIMSQMGLHIPASQGSQLPVFDDVLADIGDEQSLEQSLSTFSSHIRRISEIIGKASERSLVLLDELGAGTDPAEGASLGRAILDELDSIGVLAMVTTHIGDLKTYALSNPRAENAAVEFDIESLQPKYHVHIGDVGQSNALKIARRLSLPEHLVARAEKYLEEQTGSSQPEWDMVARMRKDAEEARQAAIEAQAEAELTREALAQQLETLQRESRREDSLVEARARLQPGDRVVVPKMGYDRPGRVVKIDPRKRMATVAIGHVTWNVAIDELVPQSTRVPEPSAPARGPRGKTPKLEDFDEK